MKKNLKWLALVSLSAIFFAGCFGSPHEEPRNEPVVANTPPAIPLPKGPAPKKPAVPKIRPGFPTIPDESELVYLPINMRYHEESESASQSGYAVAGTFNGFQQANPEYTVRLEGVFRDPSLVGNGGSNGGNIWGIWVSRTPKKTLR